MAVPKDKNNAERVVIVGMGPGGMAAALEVAEKGKEVLLLENRELYTRVQKVYLNSNSYEYLAALQKKSKRKGNKR